MPYINARQPFFVILNMRSGLDNNQEVMEAIKQKFAACGREYSIFPVKNPRQLQKITLSALELAKQADGVIVASGGDGAINCVVNHAYHCGCPVGLLPQGTFNLFARTHAVPETIGQALDVLLKGYFEPVQLGLINDRIFLVNGSLGLYPRVLEDREAFKRQFGRSRAKALLATLISLLKDYRFMRLNLQGEKGHMELSTYTLFVGNNRLQLEQIGIDGSENLNTGKLAAIILKPVGRTQMLKLIWNSAFSMLGDDENVEHFYFEKLHVQRRGFYRHRVKVALDGEVFKIRMPLIIQIAKNPLNLIKPEPDGLTGLGSQE